MGKLADKTRKLYMEAGAVGAHTVGDALAKQGNISKEEMFALLGQWVSTGIEAAMLLVEVAGELDKLEEILQRARETEKEIETVKKLIVSLDAKVDEKIGQ